MRKGVSLVEALVASVIIATVLLGLAVFQTTTLKVSNKEKDRAFATQKAVQIMEEILAFQVTSGTAADQNVDTLAQGDNEYSFKLTIDPKVNSPTLRLSDNVAWKSGYKFVRQIHVEPLPNEKGARRVTVAVFYGDGAATAGPVDNTKPLALVTNIVKAQAARSIATQVYDMYLIDIENVPGWWVDPNTLRDIMASTIDFLKNNNPGLEIRPHWIRRLAYGRDPYYTPIGNKAYLATSTANVPNDYAYVYPGRLNSSYTLYNPDVLKGQMRVDGNPAQYAVNNTLNTKAGYYENQSAYAFADQWNHAVRYPEEVEKYNNAVAAAKAAGTPVPEMSLRMFLEEMAAGRLRNAIVVNLHAELIPTPPVRNFSDAAKVPNAAGQLAWVKSNIGVDLANDTELDTTSRARLVSHPYQMEVSGRNDGNWAVNNTCELRVFPYLTPHATINQDTEPTHANMRKAQIVLREMRTHIADWNSGGPEKDVEIVVCHKFTSDVTVNVRHHHTDNQWTSDKGWHDDNNANQSHTHPYTFAKGYQWVRIWPTGDIVTDSGYPFLQSVSDLYLKSVTAYNNADNNKDIHAGDIVIKLENIPYTTTPITEASGKISGLPGTQRLHTMNYFPDPNLPFLDDDQTTAENQPRNTARFRVFFNVKDAGVYEALTTIGDQDELDHHQAPNRSRTYFWVNTPAPFTEQYQLVGDPRLMPDVTARYYQRYNRYFDNYTTTGYTNGGAWAFPQTADGWVNADTDMPRYFELWRRAVTGANALYLNPAGFSFYYHGLGGELFHTDSAVSISNKPWDGTTNLANHETVIGAPELLTGPSSWYAKPWLGELYPNLNTQWNNWKLFGNMPSSTFRWKTYSDVTQWGPGGANNDRTKRVGSYGCQSLFNGGSSNFDGATSFNHLGRDGNNSALTSNGQLVATGFKMYLDSQYPSSRPYQIDEAPSWPGWNSTESGNWRTKLEWGLNNGPIGYYVQANDATEISVAPIVMRRRDGSAGYFVLSSAAPAGSSGTTTLARLSVAASLQAIFDLASPNYRSGGAKGGEAIKLLPHTKITAPVEDSQLTGNNTWIEWENRWERWNGENYSQLQNPNYGSTSNKPNLVYHLKYSTDSGATWKYLNANVSCRPGVYDPNYALNYTATSSGGVTGGKWKWDYGGWANKEYLVRLEVYRNHAGYEATHYAFHQMAFTLAH